MSAPVVRVSVVVPLELVEEARALALELVPGGFEERARGDEVELGLYVPETAVDRLRSAFPGAGATPVEPGWEDAWRAFHRPVRAGGIWIGPPWEQPPPGEPAVVIDPGRAFGTGAHATTRLCVELLAVAARGSLLDVGCGSGVLSIAASRLGFHPVRAVDNDPVAVETTIANALVNGVSLEAAVLDGEVDELPAVDIAVANVLLAPVERILARLDARVAITSGYLAAEHPDAPGWRSIDRVELDGWAADRFERVE
jgi:ribosomal protein L11 methyltransferase